MKSLSRVRLLATPWTAAHQAPLSMGFSRQEYWSGVPLPSLFCLLVKVMKEEICNPQRHPLAKAFSVFIVLFVKSLQSCEALCDLMDYRPPDSSVHGILQARTLEWVAISFSRRSP